MLGLLVSPQIAFHGEGGIAIVDVADEPTDQLERPVAAYLRDLARKGCRTAPRLLRGSPPCRLAASPSPRPFHGRLQVGDDV